MIMNTALITISGRKFDLSVQQYHLASMTTIRLHSNNSEWSFVYNEDVCRKKMERMLSGHMAEAQSDVASMMSGDTQYHVQEELGHDLALVLEQVAAVCGDDRSARLMHSLCAWMRNGCDDEDFRDWVLPNYPLDLAPLAARMGEHWMMEKMCPILSLNQTSITAVLTSTSGLSVHGRLWELLHVGNITLTRDRPARIIQNAWRKHRRMKSARIIQSAWLRCLLNPRFRMCRKVFLERMSAIFS